MAEQAEKPPRAFRAPDLILYGCVLAMAALAFLFFFPRETGRAEGISGMIDGDSAFFYAFAEEKLSLFSDAVKAEESESAVTLTVTFGAEKSVIVIDKSARTARVAETDCAHRDCTKITVERAGDAIVCLPYLLVVEGTGNSVPSPGVG